MKAYSPLLTPLLFVPGVLVEAIVRSRNGLYSAGIFARRRLPNPVISIGNMTLGGSGKTPLVIYIASFLKETGYSPALLSRGYGRSEADKDHVLAPGDEVPSPACKLGDEPALIQRRVPGVWLGISQKRHVVASRILQKHSNQIFILDDGFQHRQLHRDLDIVVTDVSQPLAGNRIFPLGTLREPLSGLRRAHVVVITGMSFADPGDWHEKLIREKHPAARIFRCNQEIGDLVPLECWMNPGCEENAIPDVKSVYLVAAVGNPQRFRRDVEALGLNVKGSRFFRDHYRPDSKQWLECAAEAHKLGSEAIITTEKDAIKLPRRPIEFPMLVALQSVRVSDDAEFKRMILKIIEGGR